MTLLPNEFHGALGDHGEDMPIENLRLSHDKKYLVSSGHDDKLQFWDVAHLFQEEQVAAEESEDKEQDISHDKQEEEEEKEEKEQDSDDDGWSTDSDSEKKKRKKKQKKTKVEKKKNIKTTAFFADL